MSPDYGLHGLHGTMPPSCSVFPCARGNGLSVPQLLASSTHSQTAEKKKKKGSEAVLHHKDCISPDSSTVPWMPLRGGPPHHMTACCWLSLSHWEAANLTVSQKAQCYCGYWWFYRFCHSLCISPLYILMAISDHSSQGTKVVFPSGG